QSNVTGSNYGNFHVVGLKNSFSSFETAIMQHSAVSCPLFKKTIPAIAAIILPLTNIRLAGIILLIIFDMQINGKDMSAMVENLPEINFDASESQKMIAEMVRDFSTRRIRPRMMEWDEDQIFPVELFHELGDLGLMGVLVPQEYGGAGFGYIEYITAIAELAKVDGSIGLSMAAHNSLCTNHILMFGNEEQKRRYLPKLASGEWI